MLGVLFSVIAGLLMSLQGVFNTRTSEKIGLWETNTIVQASGFLLTLIILLIWGTGNLKNIKEVNKLYLLGGVFGAGIIYTVMEGISRIGTTYAISSILVAQLASAGIIDSFGLFGTKQVSFGISKILGIIIMIIGIVLFKWKG